MNYTEKIKEGMKDKTLVVGKRQIVKGLKCKELEVVYAAKNIDEEFTATVQKYAKLADIKVEKIGIESDELGTLCKKPFSVLVCGLKVKK